MPAVTLRGGPRPPLLSLSFFPDVFDQHPLARQVSWEALAERLCAFPVREDTQDKRHLPCWAPVHFQGEGARTASVTAVSCLVLDIDGGVGIEEALDRCVPFTVALHTSWSHQEAAPRFRLVLPLAQQMPGARWRQAWAQAVEALGLPVDRGCRNANRRYLLPARPREEAFCRSELRTTDQCLALPVSPGKHPAAMAASTPRRVVVPPHRLEGVVRHRLAQEPAVRRRLAESLGARLRGSGCDERASGLVCPACGRPSAWFLVAPERATWARCNHVQTCGWTGPVSELLGVAS